VQVEMQPTLLKTNQVDPVVVVEEQLNLYKCLLFQVLSQSQLEALLEVQVVLERFVQLQEEAMALLDPQRLVEPVDLDLVDHLILMDLLVNLALEAVEAPLVMVQQTLKLETITQMQERMDKVLVLEEVVDNKETILLITQVVMVLVVLL
jgi:hypothetical protein